MARISTYTKDTGLSDKDTVVGSNYISGGPGNEIYETATFTLKDLQGFFRIGEPGNGSVTEVSIDTTAIPAFTTLVTNETSTPNITFTINGGENGQYLDYTGNWSTPATGPNDFLTGLSFVEGTITATISNQDNVTVDLDGRYLQSLSIGNTTYISLADGGTAQAPSIQASLSAVDATEAIAADARFLTKDNTWGIPSYTTIATTDGTYINLTPDEAESGTVTITADFSATGTADGTTFLRGDNTWDTPAYYTDADVDTHLNISTAEENKILSWNGSDYAWVDDNNDNDNDFLTGLAFADGTLTATVSNQADVTASLDGRYLPLAGGTMTGAIAMGTNKITGLGNPTENQDAATKAYVDGLVEGGLTFKDGFNATTGDLDSSSDNLTGATRVALAVGDYYVVTTAGDFYGDTNFPLTIGDSVIAKEIAAADSSDVNDWVIIQGDDGVTSFSNSNGTFVSFGTENTNANGAVNVGTVDLSATAESGNIDNTKFLRGDNKWAVPSYYAHPNVTVSDSSVDVDQLGYGAGFSAITGVTRDDQGHVSGIAVSNYTLPASDNTNTQRSDEEIQDVVGAFISGSGATTVTYDDDANTLVISSTDTNTNTQRTDEEIQNIVGAMLSGSGATTVTYDDEAGTISISSTDTDTDTQRTDESIQDLMGATISGSGATTVTYDNEAGTIVISSTDTDTDTDTNNYLTEADFNTDTGELSLTVLDIEDAVTVDLDGRYLESIVANTGIQIEADGVTITNTDLGSAQNIFKNFTVGETSLSANSNNDTLIFEAGDNVTITTEADPKKIIIAAATPLTLGTEAGTALEGDTVTITEDQATAIAENSDKISFPGFGTTEGTALEGNTALFDGDYNSLSNLPTLGTAAASAATDFVAVTGDTMTGALHIETDSPKIKLQDNLSTNYNYAGIEFFNASNKAGALEYINNPGFAGTRLSYESPVLSQYTFFGLKSGLADFSTVNISGGVTIKTDGVLQVNGSNDSYFANGSVGIGTTDPGEKLEVNGNIKMNETAATADTDKFVVLDGGVLKYRTGAEVRSDIGAGTSSFDGDYNSLSNLPTLGTAAASSASAFVAVAGDTMTGALTMTGSGQQLLLTSNTNPEIKIGNDNAPNGNAEARYSYHKFKQFGQELGFELSVYSDEDDQVLEETSNFRIKQFAGNGGEYDICDFLNANGSVQLNFGNNSYITRLRGSSIYITDVLTAGRLTATASGDHYISNGSLGIGTTSPGAKLDVAGNGLFANGNTPITLQVGEATGFTNQTYSTLKLSQGGGNFHELRGIKSSDEEGSVYRMEEYTDGDLVRRTQTYDGETDYRIYADNFVVNSGSSALTGDLTVSGNVGIGDTTPSYKLDVNGTIRATGDVIAFSDIRVKENITTIENALDKVKKLRGVEYNKIDNPERSIGVIAQEIEEVIPQVVKEDNEGMKSVAYGNITAVLIEAIKEQQKQIDELKNQLNAYTKRW